MPWVTELERCSGRYDTPASAAAPRYHRVGVN